MIMGYHGFRDWQVMKLDSDDLANEYTFGFELEVQKGESVIDKEDMSDRLENEFGSLFVYERDGSIGEGFEIISQPMTWNFFKSNISKFKRLFELLNEANYRSHNGNKCGLHVHIGKQGLGLSTQEQEELIQYGRVDMISYYQKERIGDVATNINIQLERFKDELFKFSRRNRASLERWCNYLNSEKILDNGHQFIDKDLIRANTKPRAMGSTWEGDRYKAFNLNNSKTVELRLFRGTLKWKTFYFTLNLVNNLIFNAKLESTIVDWNDIAFRGLSASDKSLCKSYCVGRNINLSRNISVALNINKRIEKDINKRQLLNFLLNDD